MRKFIILLGVMIALVLSGCSVAVTDQSMRTLHYSGGITEGEKFEECVGPGVKQVDGEGEHYYPYPLTQREWVYDTNGGQSADEPNMTFTDKDGIAVSAVAKIQLFLNSDCTPVEVNGKRYEGGTLQAFHELIGKTRGAYFNNDGSYNDGWLWVLKNYVSRPAVQLFQEAGHTRTVEDMWLDPQVRRDMATEIAEKMEEAVNAGMQTDLQFFNGFSITIDKIEPDADYRKQYADRRAAQVKAETAELNRDAQVAEAEAKKAVAKAEADVVQEQIRGFGGDPLLYLCNKALELGKDCFVPGGPVIVNRNR